MYFFISGGTALLLRMLIFGFGFSFCFLSGYTSGCLLISALGKFSFWSFHLYAPACSFTCFLCFILFSGIPVFSTRHLWLLRFVYGSDQQLSSVFFFIPSGFAIRFGNLLFLAFLLKVFVRFLKRFHQTSFLVFVLLSGPFNLWSLIPVILIFWFLIPWSFDFNLSIISYDFQVSDSDLSVLIFRFS